MSLRSLPSLPSYHFARPRIRPMLLTRQRHDRIPHCQTRKFFPPSLMSTGIQRISASRTLPYPALPIYLTIANVSEYHSFLPYCLSSRVTHWSEPDKTLQRRWPERAELEIGWGAVRERFASKIYCVPGKVVEAVAGDGVTSVRPQDIAHHSHAAVAAEKGVSGEIFSHLTTRWEVVPAESNSSNSDSNSTVVSEAADVKTKVMLNVEVKFVNPVYAAMSQLAAEKVALTMIEAFEAKVVEEMRKGHAIDKAAQQTLESRQAQ